MVLFIFEIYYFTIVFLHFFLVAVASKHKMYIRVRRLGLQMIEVVIFSTEFEGFIGRAKF